MSAYAFFATPVVALVFIFVAANGLVPAIKAQFGHGQPGVFTATSQDCSGNRGRCRWVGEFVGNDGRHRDLVELSTGGAQPNQYGESVRAVDSGDKQQVFPAGGSGTWWVPLLFVVVGLGILVNWARSTVIPKIRSLR